MNSLGVTSKESFTGSDPVLADPIADGIGNRAKKIVDRRCNFERPFVAMPLYTFDPFWINYA